MEHGRVHSRNGPVAPAQQAGPRLIFWELTPKCNLRCVHCRAWAQQERSADELTTEQGRAFIDRLVAWADPILVLTGGEPLYRPDWNDLAQHAASSGLTVALATNGTLVDDATARQIATSGVRRVSISLDGADAATHDSFRGVPGSYDQAVAGLRRLRNLGVSVQINMTVARHNVDQLDEALDRAIALGCDAFHLFLLVPVGCGIRIAETQQIEAQRYEEVLAWLAERSKTAPIGLRATCAPHYFRVARQRGGQMTPPRGHGDTGGDGAAPGRMHAATRGCLAGSGVCFVSHRGDVQPCGYLPLVVGNVLERDLRDIWHHSPEFARLRDPEGLGGKCGLCEFRTLCMGCRARAYAATGDIMAEEPFCVYEPKRLQRG